MSTNKAYAQRLKSMGYARNIIAFKRCNEVPDIVNPMVIPYLFSVQLRQKCGRRDGLPFTLRIKMSSAEVPSIRVLALTG